MVERRRRPRPGDTPSLEDLARRIAARRQELDEMLQEMARLLAEADQRRIDQDLRLIREGERLPAPRPSDEQPIASESSGDR